jgi:hypothetical protein
VFSFSIHTSSLLPFAWQIVFTKTTLLSVKVETLRCFLAMVTILDKVSRHTMERPSALLILLALQAVLTQKLVPLLAKIRTKGELRIELYQAKFMIDRSSWLVFVEPSVMVRLMDSLAVWLCAHDWWSVVTDGNSRCTRGHGNESRPRSGSGSRKP